MKKIINKISKMMPMGIEMFKSKLAISEVSYTDRKLLIDAIIKREKELKMIDVEAIQGDIKTGEIE